jgi:hypothetical protein
MTVGANRLFLFRAVLARRAEHAGELSILSNPLRLVRGQCYGQPWHVRAEFFVCGNG